MIKRMNAFVRRDAANQEVQLSEVNVPVIRRDEVLIKVEAFGVGIHDRYFIPADAKFPYIIGSEAAGVITKLGDDVSGFAIGDRVIFTTILQPQGGCWARYAAAKQASLIPLPDELTFEQGASVPIAGKTALECMRSLELNSGDTLFIAGASGAIGTLVIQLATAKGINVSASASEKNHAYMESLGVKKAVDYNNPNWPVEIKAWAENGVDAALAIQPGTGPDSIKTVRDGGKLITVSGDNHTMAEERNIHIAQMGHNQDTQHEVIALVNSMARGEVKIIIDKVYPFERALEALEKTETRHARGKTVVSVNE